MRYAYILFFVFIMSFSNGLYKKTTYAEDLVHLIPRLYGGDGVQLETRGSHQPHFQAQALVKLSELATAASEINFPIPNSQGGFTFNFDPLLDDYVRKSDSLGPIYAERGETIGKGRLNLGFNYTFIDFTRFDGDDLGKLSVVLDHQDDPPAGLDSPAPGGYKFEQDKVILDVDIKLKSHIFSFYGSYGLTKNIEVGFLVPVIRNELRVKSVGRVVEDASKLTASPPFDTLRFHSFDPAGIDGDGPIDRKKDEKIGFGDIILRAKYNIIDKPMLKISPAVQLRLPTGNDNNLMGLNRLGIKPYLIVSANFPLLGGAFSPHFNLGYEVNAGIDGQDEIDYTVGFDYGREIYGDLVTLAVDVIASHETQKRDNVGDDIIDLSVGSKWNCYKQSLIYANVIVPLNDQGLRPDIISSVGVEVAIR